MIDSEFMICGFKAISYGGALVLSLDKKSLDHLCQFSREMDQVIEIIRFRMKDEGCPQIDYLRFNDLSKT